MRRRILLVDDDERLRRALARGLGSRGFEVTTAASALEAVDRAAEAPGAFDVAVLDIELGDGWGASLAVELQLHQPAMKVIYVSGHAADDPILRQGIQDHMAFLEKPFRVGDLIRVIGRVLEEAQGSDEPGG